MYQTKTGLAMDLFSWLLVGHLVGDWLLQNDWMAEGKQSGLASWPLTVHCLTYTVTVCVAVLLGASVSGGLLVGAAAILFISHWLIDGGNLAQRWGRLTRQSNTSLVRTGVDQTMHVAVLAGIAAWLGA